MEDFAEGRAITHRPLASLASARRARLWWGVAAVILVLVAVTACGGDTKKATPTPADYSAMAVVTPTPGTPPPRTPTLAASDQTYVVKEGDTISTIAARFGVSEDDLERLNHITDPNSIMAGQKLIIPAPKP